MKEIVGFGNKIAGFFGKKKEVDTDTAAINDLRAVLNNCLDEYRDSLNSYTMDLWKVQREIKRKERRVDLVDEDTEVRKLDNEIERDRKIEEKYLNRCNWLNDKISKIHISLANLRIIEQDIATKKIGEKLKYENKLLQLKKKTEEGEMGEVVEEIYSLLDRLVKESESNLPVDIELLTEKFSEKEENVSEKENEDSYKKTR